MKLFLLYLFFATLISSSPSNPQAIFSVPECPIDIPISCTNSTPIANSCCFESPGGILLQTQFWDYQPAIGPDDLFTLHGLWPDNCDGSYFQFCDRDLEIEPNGRTIESIIVGIYGDEALYGELQRVWKDWKGQDKSLWAHEFNKHGTCVNTIHPTCYANDFKPHRNVYDYFNISVELYKKLPSYNWLVDAGITPSETRTYSKQEISDALSKNFGSEVFFKCDSSNALNEIWYYHHIQGSLLQRKFIPIPTVRNSNCPNEGIKFLPKGSKKPIQPPTPGKKGYIKLTDHDGCLISNGHWYTQGTCATFRIIEARFGGVNIRSSRGYCGLNPRGQFACHSGIDHSFQFQIDKDGKIGYGGKYDWCFDKDGSTGGGKNMQVPIILSDGSCDETFQIYLSSR